MPYADADDLIARFDERTIADLLSDDGAPAVDLANNARLSVLLSEAEGLVNSAVQTGGTYTDEDMAALVTEGGSALEHLKGIVCQLCMVLLLRRRPEKYGTATEMLKDLNEQILDPLRQGKRILDLEGRSSSAATPSADQIQVADVTEFRGITTRTRNYYPNRGTSLPLSRLGGGF